MIGQVFKKTTSLVNQTSQNFSRQKKYFKGLSDKQIKNLKEIQEFELLNHINRRFDNAGKVAGIPEDRLRFYRTCDQLVRFQLPYKTDEGKISQVTAYRVIHKTHRLPAKGGLRINRYNTSQDLEAIALQNALRAAIFDIPYGGSKGLISINPYTITEEQKQVLIKRYTIELAKKNLIGPSIDLIGPAIGSGSREMNWIKDTYQNYFGQDDVHAIACCTGKSVSNFGIEGAQEAQGYGISYCLKYLLDNPEFCRKNKLEGGLKGKKFIVQGFGNTGYHTSKFLVKEGAILIGVMEYDGCVYNENGINPDQLLNHMNDNEGEVSGFKDAEFIEDDGAMDKECDIYIPCWTENVIHKENQQRLKCKMIAEGCNHPVTPIAGELLRDRGVFMFPDLLVNAGGVISAYFEWVKNLSHTQHGLLTKRWEQKSKMLLLDVITNITGLKTNNLNTDQIDSLKGASEFDIVISGLEQYLQTAVDHCLEVSEERNIPLRQACYVVGITKIHNHYESVGIPFTQ